MTTGAIPALASTRDDARTTLERAREHLLALQDREGWWKGELETNVTMDAEDLLLREFLGIRAAQESSKAGNWIRSKQRADGSWGNFHGAPGELSTTIEAYAALKLVGDDPEADHMGRAAAWIRAEGGLERARVFTHIWLALFGLWSWDEVPALPPEVTLLPPWFPFNVYDFACWARQTVVALTVVWAHRPVRPTALTLDELRTGVPAPPPTERRFSRAWIVRQLDRFARLVERVPVNAIRRAALRRAEAWIVARQEADGSWGGIQPPWVYSMIALHLRGYDVEHPVMRKALDGLDRFTIVDGDIRRLEACQSPVWDTALAIVALADAGVAPDDPALLSAADWLLAQEVTVRGDWAVRRPTLSPGGWAFEFHNVNYPDVDDTAEVVLALRRVAHPEPARLDAAIRRAVIWLDGMRSKDAVWGAFDADNTRAIMREIPFCDFGEVIDPPSSDVTAHAVEMLAHEGEPTDEAVAWLLSEQEESGSWFGRWGANHVYGVGCVVPALVAAGVAPGHPAIRRAVAWLERVRNPDGGWGEDLRSYRDPAWIARGASTASQTAWALLALLAAGERSDTVERGVRFLVDTQRPDGSWDEPEYTGTGFPGDFYINYHLYRLLFPLTALGRYLDEGGGDAPWGSLGRHRLAGVPAAASNGHAG